MAADQVEESSFSDPLYDTHQISIKTHEALREKGYYFNCHLRIVKESICSNKVYPVVKKREAENNNSKRSFNVMRKFGPLCHFH